MRQIYDMLYMMGRDDVSVGMGGEGGITEDGRSHTSRCIQEH